MIAVFPFLLLFIGAVVSLAGLKSQKIRNIILTIILLFALIFNSYILIQSITTYEYYSYGPIIANASGLFMSEIILLLGFLIHIYSVAYLKNGLNNTIYYTLSMLFLFSMIGLTLSFNLVIMYAMVEAATITSAIMILYQRTRASLRAVGIYIAANLTGTLFILIGIFALYISLGTLDLTDLLFLSHPFDNKVSVALALIIGFGIKAGLVPAGLIWIPKAYSEAPTPVSALLSGVFAQVAAFALIRSVGIIALGEKIIFEILLLLGILSAFTGSILALLEVIGVSVGIYKFRCDIKRMLAFSSISEIGIIIFIVGIFANIKFDIILFLTPAMIHITNHAIAKSTLFLSAGNFIHSTKTRNISFYNGLLKKLPMSAFSFILAGLTISMIPPLFGFTTIKEVSVLTGNKVYTPVIIAVAALTFICYAICFFKAFKGRQMSGKAKEDSLPIIPLIILDIVLLILGIGFFSGLINVQNSGLDEVARTILEI